MNKFIENQNDLLYFSDIELSLRIVSSWLEARPDNLELRKLSKALVGVSFYVNKLQLERYSYEQLIGNYRQDKNRAIMRSRKAEEQIEKLEEQIKLAKYEL